MAKWVEFNSDWDARTSPCKISAFRKGAELYLPDQLADEAISKGVARLAPDKAEDVAKVPAPARRTRRNR